MSKKIERKQPGHPPEYANRIAIPPPSSRSDEERKGTPYRLGLLKETTNLYHWALWWSIHRGYDWTLGTSPHSFVLRRCPLGLLPARQKLGNKEDAAADSPRWVETYEDVIETIGWDDIDAISYRGNGFIGTIRPPVRLASGEMVSLPPNISYLGDTNELNEHTQPPEATEPTETAEVMSVTFKMAVDCLPWYLITNALRRAQLDARDLLEANGTHWTSPPFFHECESGRELLDNIRDREWKPLAVLRKLEKHRKKQVGVITAALNPPEPAVLDPDEIAARNARMQTREIAKDDGTTQVSPVKPVVGGDVHAANLGATGDRGVIPEEVSDNAPTKTKRKWTEADADAKIREYKANHSEAYSRLPDLVKANRKGANKEAKRIFGRNSMAEALGIPPATVSKTKAWAETSSMFEWGKDKASSRSVRSMKRTGLEIADEAAGKARGDVVAQAVEGREREETFRIIRTMPQHTNDEKRAVEELVDKLIRGDVTDDDARKIAELSKQQVVDKKTKVVKQDP